jgi:hypothetical protein
MSLTLAIARGTGSLPHQSLEQKMTLLGLTVASTNEIRTANPAQLDADGVGADAASLDGIGQEP